MPIILAKQAFQFGLSGHLDISLLVNKQWGAVGSQGTFTFPVSFVSAVYAATCVKRASAGDFSPYTSNWGRTSLSYGAGNNASIIVLGK